MIESKDGSISLEWISETIKLTKKRGTGIAMSVPRIAIAVKFLLFNETRYLLY